MEFKLHNGSGGLCCKSCGRQDKQLNTYDWLGGSSVQKYPQGLFPQQQQNSFGKRRYSSRGSYSRT